MALSGELPVESPDPWRDPSRPRGSTYGRAGTRWMVDPEAIWRLYTSGRVGPAFYAVLITDGPGNGGSVPRIRQADAGFARMTGYTVEAADGIAFDVIAGPATDRERLAASTRCVRTSPARSR